MLGGNREREGMSCAEVGTGLVIALGRGVLFGEAAGGSEGSSSVCVCVCVCAHGDNDVMTTANDDRTGRTCPAPCWVGRTINQKASQMHVHLPIPSDQSVVSSN